MFYMQEQISQRRAAYNLRTRAGSGVQQGEKEGGKRVGVPIRQLYTIGEQRKTGCQETSMRFDGIVSVSWSYSTFMDAWPASPMRMPSCCSIG